MRLKLFTKKGVPCEHERVTAPREVARASLPRGRGSVYALDRSRSPGRRRLPQHQNEPTGLWRRENERTGGQGCFERVAKLEATLGPPFGPPSWPGWGPEVAELTKAAGNRWKGA